ncbi:MAG: Asp-tRNA(Asn)/Glu-tRNA(Gln) amidotransferase subunit GatA [Parcubacteria group bacterium]|nr:Asp-tRNA(Asn)/Glu-tRNA(Gln) amidotransferase subunit GatA [Parcubacteria group bacterium]
MDLFTLTLTQASEGLAKKEFSSVELTAQCLARIQATDERLHCFITLNKEGALAAAKSADDRRGKGESRPLLGIPASMKDVIATKGVKTTACSHILGDYVPPFNATCVQKLADAGLVMVGKTNCDAFAHGASTENSDFGPSHNPWDVSRVPGGSSGGSAASMVAQHTFYTLGTDTGGSIRQPASFVGITSLKPTYGRVSRYGLFSMTSSTDVVSPMAKTAEDIALVMQAIAGKDNHDSTTLEKPVPKYREELAAVNMKGIKIGIPKEYFIDGMNKAVREAVELAMEEYKKLGAVLVPISLPHTSYAVAVYYIITPCEISSNLAKYDGIRFGYSAATDLTHAPEVKSLFDVYTKSRRYGLGDEAKRRIMLGTYALSAGYYDAYYKKAMQVRTLICRDFDEAFKNVDMILTPTSPKVAFKIGAQANDPLEMYLEDIFVAPASLAGLPAMNVPCGFAAPPEDDKLSLPVGFQLMAPQFEESRILQAAHAYQQVTDWHTKYPSL